MKVTIEFDLDKDEDRKHYNAWIKMKEIRNNLDNLKEKIDDLHVMYIKYERKEIIDMKIYFDEMIWRKLG